MLFLHGVAGAAWSWAPQRAALADAFALFVWEARGHGSAARVADAGLADYWQDACEALAAPAARAAGPLSVVGHSMGGLLAMRLATEFPAQVERLVLIDPVYASGWGDIPEPLGRIAGALFEPVVQSFAHNGRLAQAISRRTFRWAFEDPARMEAAWLEQRKQVPIEYPRMLREGFTGLTGIVLRDDAQAIAVPTVVLEGSSGRQRPRFPALIETLRGRLGERFRYDVIPGGHYLQLDQPAAVDRLLRAYLTGEANEAAATDSAPAAGLHYLGELRPGRPSV